jgi:hypothetical protein
MSPNFPQVLYVFLLINIYIYLYIKIILEPSQILPTHLLDMFNLSTIFLMKGDNILLSTGCEEDVLKLKSEVITKYYYGLRDFYNNKNYYIYNNNLILGKTESIYSKNYLKLFGLEFLFSNVSNDLKYTLTDRTYHPLELYLLSINMFRELHEINSKGYVVMKDLKDLNKNFMIQIHDHLGKLGYDVKYKVLGNNENTYTF